MPSQGLPVHLTLLGGFQARTAAGESLSLPTRKAQALLAYLALRPGHAHPRDTLAVLLWGDTVETRARDSFRHALTVLRKALAATRPPALCTAGHTVALHPTVVEVDVVRFEAGVAQGTPGALEQATALYQGELLAGLSVTEPLFEEWLLVAWSPPVRCARCRVSTPEGPWRPWAQRPNGQGCLVSWIRRLTLSLARERGPKGKRNAPASFLPARTCSTTPFRRPVSSCRIRTMHVMNLTTSCSMSAAPLLGWPSPRSGPWMMAVLYGCGMKTS